jgi:hypothetical protein
MEPLFHAIVMSATNPVGMVLGVGILGISLYGVYRWAHQKPKSGGDEHFTGQPPAGVTR